MSGFGGSSDGGLMALLNLVSDPAAHKAKLAELATAQQKVDDAATALDAKQNKIDGDKAKLAADVAEHKKNVSEFAADKRGITDKAAQFDKREIEVSAKEIAVEALEKVLTKAKTDFDAAADKTEADFDRRSATLADKERAVTAREAEVAGKDKLLTEKLAKLKNIAG